MSVKKICWQFVKKVRVRFCAAAVDTRFLAVIGGEMDGEVILATIMMMVAKLEGFDPINFQVLDSMKTLDLETNEWRMQVFLVLEIELDWDE